MSEKKKPVVATTDVPTTSAASTEVAVVWFNEEGHAYIGDEHARVCPKCPDPQ